MINYVFSEYRFLINIIDVFSDITNMNLENKLEGPGAVCYKIEKLNIYIFSQSLNSP